jgi:hypothetical protein
VVGRRLDDVFLQVLASLKKANARLWQALRVFPGTLEHTKKFVYINQKGEFTRTTSAWVSSEFAHAVTTFEYVRTRLARFLQVCCRYTEVRYTYSKLEETFPEGLEKLSEKAQRHQQDNNITFPGGPTEDFYTPIQDSFLQAKEKYETNVIKLEGIKLSTEAYNSTANLEISMRRRRPEKRDRGSDDHPDEEPEIRKKVRKGEKALT